MSLERIEGALRPRLGRLTGPRGVWIIPVMMIDTNEAQVAEGEHAPRKRGPVPQVQRQQERISQLPEPKQRAVMDVMKSMRFHVGVLVKWGTKPKQRAVMDVIEALLAQQGR